VVGLGAAGALAAAVVLGLALGPKPKPTVRAAVQEAPLVTPVKAVEQSGFRPAAEPYQPPNAAQVQQAKADAEAVFRAQGVSGLARASMTCFQELAKAPSYGRMDYCLALDLFGETITQSLTPGDTPSRISWFGAAGARQHNAAQGVMGAQGDADARLLDLRRMADAAAGKKPQWAAPTLPAVVTKAAQRAPAEEEVAGEAVETETSAAEAPAPPPAQSSTLAQQLAAARPTVAAAPIALPPPKPAAPAAPAVAPPPVELPPAEGQ
jgi:hypothetical protein